MRLGLPCARTACRCRYSLLCAHVLALRSGWRWGAEYERDADTSDAQYYQRRLSRVPCRRADLS